jgi:hypothetical protein
MRMLLKAEMDTEAASRAIQDGTLGQTMEKVLGALHPEAAYFTALNGRRTALIFFDLAEPSQIPSVAEPFFMELGASIELVPVMNADDVMTGVQAVGGP